MPPLEARAAFKEGAGKAKPIVMEPIMKVEVVTPEASAVFFYSRWLCTEVLGLQKLWLYHEGFKNTVIIYIYKDVRPEIILKNEFISIWMTGASPCKIQLSIYG